MSANASTFEVGRFPVVFVLLPMPFFENLQDGLPVIALAASPDLPEVVADHRLEVRSGGPKLGSVKQRLPGDERGKDLGKEIALKSLRHASDSATGCEEWGAQQTSAVAVHL